LPEERHQTSRSQGGSEPARKPDPRFRVGLWHLSALATLQPELAIRLSPVESVLSFASDGAHFLCSIGIIFSLPIADCRLTIGDGRMSIFDC
jgi:hypothetical protein